MYRTIPSNQPFISKKELNNNGISDYRIQKDLLNEKLMRINSHYFENMEYQGDIHDFSYVPLFVKDGIICLLSAASYYHYTNYRPFSIDVAIHRSKKITTIPDYPRMQFYYFSKKRLETGVRVIKENGDYFRIYNKEKTVCDILLHRNKIDREEVKNVLSGYLQDKERDLDKLSQMAEELGCYRILKTYWEVML